MMIKKLYANNRMIELRRSFPMTQKEFASMLTLLGHKRVSLSMVRKWEQGDRPIGLDKIRMVAELLKVEPHEIGEWRDAK